MLIILAMELGISCLLAAGIIWQIGRNAPSSALAQPLGMESPAPMQLSATPFLPSSATATTAVMIEPALAFPTAPDSFSPPLLPIATLETTPRPGGIAPVENGPLDTTEQLALYIASLRYLAPTTADGIRLARELNYIGKDGHPSNICGPLSIAILRETGILSPDTSLDKFWLLDPRQGTARQLLARTFPPERFENLRTKTPLNKFDWDAFPLQPGDFLYIYAGTGGNFEHMLVVNRTDGKQRAYAVTNYATPNGFVITEVLLYDANDKTAGIFHTWTKRNYAQLGSTGFGGFEIWRLRSQ